MGIECLRKLEVPDARIAVLLKNWKAARLPALSLLDYSKS